MERFGVEENVKLLVQEMSALMRIKPGGENDEWLKNLEGQEVEVHNLLGEFYELTNGMDRNNMNAKHKLNKKVTQVMKYVKVLQECINVETSRRELGAEELMRYSCEDLESFTSHFSDEIGSGGFGKVYKAQFPNDLKMAVKVLKEDDGVEEMFIAELSTMGRIYHPYLVKLYGYCFEKTMKALVYEYVEKGSLDNILYDNPHGLDWKKFYTIAINIAEGLCYLHHGCPEPIIHHDVKAANVLIDSNLSPKITDFGLAKHMKNGASHRTNTGLRGTKYYMAPELIYPWSPASPKCDVYSYGMLLFEILGMKGINQNHGWFPKQVWEKFEAGKLDDILENCGISEANSEDAEILSMVALLCSQFSPKARPSMGNVLKMLRKRMHVQNPQNPFVPSAESSLPTLQEASFGEEQIVRKRPPTKKPKRYSSEEITKFTSNFSSEIGSGASWKVYNGKFRDGVQLAVKVLEENDIDEEMFKAAVSTVGETYHQYLVKLYGYCFDKKMKALVYEYVEKGSFDKILYNNPHDLDWKKFYEIAIGIAKGLSYLHDGCLETIIHLDVKSANVLIDSNLTPKITNFGLAKLNKKDTSHLIDTGVRGTGSYVAPEVMYPFAPVSSKCDVYSFGMLLFEILGMKKNNQREGWFPKRVWEKFEAGKLDEILEGCGISEENRKSAQILSMVALCCAQFTPKARPSMSTVVKMMEEEIPVPVPQNPFWPSAESSTPTMQEEVSSKPSPSRFGLRLRKKRFRVKGPRTRTNVDLQRNRNNLQVDTSPPDLGLSVPNEGSGFSKNKSERTSTAKKSTMLESFQKRSRYPPGGEDAAVVYTTSLTANRKIFDRCREVISILSTHQVKLIERDIYIEGKYKEELRDILGVIQLPAVFVDLRYIGGAEEVITMEEEDKLIVLFEEVNREKGKSTWRDKTLAHGE